jgi:hypothetical protein
MTEHEQRHTDNFMRDFKDLLHRYKAVYKSTGFGYPTCPQIMFSGVPDGKGDTFLTALIFDLPNTINYNSND